MPLPGQPIGTPYASENPLFPADAPGRWVISESAPQYRPRHPEQTAVYQLFENHFDSYVRCYEERFEACSGPLRPVVVCSVEEFLACARLQGGFARIRCPKCHAEHLLAFSCRTRNFCASCQAKRMEHPACGIDAGQTQSLESQARYITRPGLSMDALKKQPDGSFTVQTPPDPRTGVTSITLDPLEWIHRIVAHIPDPGQHTRRSYGAYTNRSRVPARVAQEFSGSAAHPCEDDEDSEFIRERRRTWARLLRKIFEVNPMLCSCGAEMKIVSIITEPRVVDRILRHLQSERCKARDPFQPRPPPLPAAVRPQ
jgi:hypothetical protein